MNKKEIMIKSRKQKIILWDRTIKEYNKKIDKLRGNIINAHQEIEKIEKGLRPKSKKHVVDGMIVTLKR